MSVGDVVTYSCVSDEFELLGNSSATCEQLNSTVAQFSPDPPECRRKYLVCVCCTSACHKLFKNYF